MTDESTDADQNREHLSMIMGLLEATDLTIQGLSLVTGNAPGDSVTVSKKALMGTISLLELLKALVSMQTEETQEVHDFLKELLDNEPAKPE